jgi:hypothetical protein
MDEEGGELTIKSLYRMKLLDSVMRESQRVNPASMSKYKPMLAVYGSTRDQHLTDHSKICAFCTKAYHPGRRN